MSPTKPVWPKLDGFYPASAEVDGQLATLGRRGACERVGRGRVGTLDGFVVTRFASSNKCHATSNKCLTSSNKKLVVTSVRI